MAERITLTTDDEVEIAGTFENPAQATGAVLCLHMMPTDRTGWSAFQWALSERHIASLAIDLRGHGESTNRGQLDFRTFEDRDHQASRLDVQVAIAWLVAKGFSRDHIAIIGASIGANLALQALSEDEELRAGALLSPGENYRGILTLPAVAKLRDPQALLVISSSDDQESYGASQKIVEGANIRDKEMILLENAGHGTRMFDRQEDLLSLVVEWLRLRLAGPVVRTGPAASPPR